MAAHQAPLSTGFSSQEYLSGLPFPSPIEIQVSADFAQMTEDAATVLSVKREPTRNIKEHQKMMLIIPRENLNKNNRHNQPYLARSPANSL